ncbi:MAG: putative membrane protein [Polyangiales bacterium]|jgi:putative membrane protein
MAVARAAASLYGPAMDISQLMNAALAAVIFSTIGLMFFGIAFLLITKLAPFSVRKEIEDDQNTSLGIVIGSIIIGIALIVSASIHG